LWTRLWKRRPEASTPLSWTAEPTVGHSWATESTQVLPVFTDSPDIVQRYVIRECDG
jgi:hypothetical protein